jgi:hypothetical protein
MPSVTIIVSAGSGCSTAHSLDGKKRGITWRFKKSLEDSEYVDDVCLVSYRNEHTLRKLGDFWEESKKAGLEVESSKREEKVSIQQ